MVCHKAHRNAKKKFFSRPKKSMVHGLLMSGMASMAVQSLESVAETHTEYMAESTPSDVSEEESPEPGEEEKPTPHHGPPLAVVPHHLTTIDESLESQP